MKIVRVIVIIHCFFFVSCINDHDDNYELVDKIYLSYQAENYTDMTGYIRKENNNNASNNQCVHIGPDTNNENECIGDALFYDFELKDDFSMGIFEIWYSDDVGGNIIHVYLDGVKKGCFRTLTTGGWNVFIPARHKISLQQINKGKHTIKLELTKGGSWGVLLDYFKVTNKGVVDNFVGAYDYLKNLINKNTGLVLSSDYDVEFTTVYKNSLAAMAFIHENDINLAEGIFNFFNLKYHKNKNSFNGFNKNWNPETGEELAQDHWEGDNAFLLLALNYYNQVIGSFGDYQEMVEGLVKWLSERADYDIIAEGLANMYAALKPFENTISGMDLVLAKLKNGFNNKKDYKNVLDHIMRGALCFSDISGFNHINNFNKSETWKFNGIEVNALKAFSGEDFINVEISSQILLAWKIWKSKLSVDCSFLDAQLNKLWLLGFSAPAVISLGLPYFLSDINHGWPGCYDQAIIDPTCYMLFYNWEFNPMAPGKKGY